MSSFCKICCRIRLWAAIFNEILQRVNINRLCLSARRMCDRIQHWDCEYVLSPLFFFRHYKNWDTKRLASGAQLVPFLCSALKHYQSNRIEVLSGPFSRAPAKLNQAASLNGCRHASDHLTLTGLQFTTVAADTHKPTQTKQLHGNLPCHTRWLVGA